MATIDDVAKLAGVSKGTVSSVFSKKRPISVGVTERVLSIAKELNYAPSHVARSLAIKKTMIVGLRMPILGRAVMSGFEIQMINGVIQECTKHGYRVLIDPLPDQDDLTTYSIDPVDGLIMLNPRKDDPRIERYTSMGIPLVLIGRPDARSEAISYVDNNNEEMAFQVGMYLLENGHREILFLNAAPDMTVAVDRTTGLKRAFDQAGIPFREDQVLYYSRKRFTSASEYGFSSIMETFQTNSYTAVVTDTERVALGVFRASKELGIEIPQDLSIISLCNDVTLAEETTPLLTSVDLSVDKLGSEAAKILIEKMNDTDVARQVIIEAKLVIRGSCQFHN